MLTEGRPRVILIGGREAKDGNRLILGEVAAHARMGALVVATLASEEAPRQWATYREVFTDLGVPEVRHLAIESREEAADPAWAAMLEGAGCIFFTGGDQLKITTKLGGTSLYSSIKAAFRQRGVALAGTSAGASAMGETMLVSSGPEGDAENHKVKSAFAMARGLGFIRDMVIDQHFAQRARIERLVGAIAENPSVLGVGIDEDTALVLDGVEARVIGSGAVYVTDGSGVTYSNISEVASERALCLLDVRLHVLVHGSLFNLATRRPSPPA